MKTNIVIVISPPIPYLAKFWFLSRGSKCFQPIKLQDSLKCNISRKKFIFWLADKYQSFLQVDTIILGVCNQAYPKYPKQEVRISLPYHQKSMGDEVDFLPADKHESFLQVDSINLGVGNCSLHK